MLTRAAQEHRSYTTRRDTTATEFKGPLWVILYEAMRPWVSKPRNSAAEHHHEPLLLVRVTFCLQVIDSEQLASNHHPPSKQVLFRAQPFAHLHVTGKQRGSTLPIARTAGEHCVASALRGMTGNGAER